MKCPFELPLYSAEFTGAFDSIYCVRDPSGELICDNLLKVEADYIIQAINSYEKLVEALKKSKVALLNWNPEDPWFPEIKRDFSGLMEDIDEALAEAEKE